GRLLPYCSPEQIRGEAIDLRSNLFTVGTILYEMVVGKKAFDAADPVALVSQIENEMPASPSRVNVKIHPAVSALIMKALAKDPAQRYQSAHELLDDLEKCKENGKKATPELKKTTPAPGAVVSSAARAAAASKFVSAASSAPKPRPSAPSVPAKPASPRVDAPVFSVDPPAAEGKAAAAAAGAGGVTRFSDANSDASSVPNSGAQIIGEFDGELEVNAPEFQAAPGPVLSAAVVEQESEQELARVAVEPMMSASEG